MDGREGRSIVLLVKDTVDENQEALITGSLLLYVVVHLLIGIGGITFPSQPAAASYHLGPPSASLLSPSDGAFLASSDITLEATGDDPDGTNLDITFFLDGSNVGTYTVCDTCTASHTETGVSEGSHNWYVNVCDQAGDCTTSSTWSFIVDITPPLADCIDCVFPDPVKGGNDVTFEASTDRPIGVANSGVDQVDICRQHDCGGADPLFCSYDPDAGEDSCSYTTPDSVSDTVDYWIRLTDHAGNTAIFPGDSNPGDADQNEQNFTIKKGLGAICSSDDECLLGSCVDNTCQFGYIPPPQIFFTSLTSQPLDGVMLAGFFPSQQQPGFRIFRAGREEQLQLQVRNPLPVPDSLRLSFSGSAVDQQLIRVAQHPGLPSISCRPDADQCTIILPAETARHVNVSVTGERYGRGTLHATVISSASEKSASQSLKIGVKAPGLLDQLQQLLVPSR